MEHVGVIEDNLINASSNINVQYVRSQINDGTGIDRGLCPLGHGPTKTRLVLVGENALHNESGLHDFIREKKRKEKELEINIPTHPFIHSFILLLFLFFIFPFSLFQKLHETHIHPSMHPSFSSSSSSSYFCPPPCPAEGYVYLFYFPAVSSFISLSRPQKKNR